MKTQKGICITGIDRFELRDDCVLPEPHEIVSTGAIIRPVIWSACTTDAELAHSGCASFPYLLNKASGHEMCGIIETVGPEVTDFAVGDRVSVCATMPKWRSMLAQEGHARQSSDNMYFGIEYPDRGGSFVEHYYIRDADMNLAKIPDKVTWEQAIMVPDMMQTAFAGVQSLDMRYGDSVAVLGIGPVGLMAICAARLQGASQIYAVGGRKVCRDLAGEYGATHVIDYHEGDIVEQILARSGGAKVDTVLCCGGPADQLNNGLKLLKAGGTLASVSVYYGGVPIQIDPESVGFGYSDKTIKFIQCDGGRSSMRRLIALVAEGRVQPEKMITHRFYGMEQIEDAVNLFVRHEPSLIKPVIFNGKEVR